MRFFYTEPEIHWIDLQANDIVTLSTGDNSNDGVNKDESDFFSLGNSNF